MNEKCKITDIGSPVKTFINQTIKEIEEGLPKGYKLTTDVNFELSVVNEKSKKGKVDLKVLSLGGNVETQNIQKVRFAVGDPKTSQDNLKKAFKIIKEALTEKKKKNKKK